MSIVNNIFTKMTKKNIFRYYELFLATNLFSPRTSLDNNKSSLVSKTKFLAINTIRLLSLLFIIRALIAITLPKCMTKKIICEYFQFYGNPTPIQIGLFAGSLCCNLCAIPYQYSLYTYKSRVFAFMNKIKKNDIEYKLNYGFQRKFQIRLQVLSLLCLPYAPNSILLILYWTFGLLFVYLKEDYNLISK